MPVVVGDEMPARVAGAGQVADFVAGFEDRLECGAWRFGEV